MTALIAAGAGIFGGLLSAFATRSVERLRLHAALVEKAEERKLASIERFLLAANGWLDWLVYMDDRGWKDKLDELNRRVKERDDSYRELLLLASDPLHDWLVNKYSPLEYKLKETYSRQVRFGTPRTEEAKEVRRAFSKLLREDMISVVRPEIATLRNPVNHSRLAAR
jgi:hypothetical protein